MAMRKCNKSLATTHDVLWIAWKSLGEYMSGEQLDWANGLKNKIVRNAIVD